MSAFFWQSPRGGKIGTLNKKKKGDCAQKISDYLDKMIFNK